VVDMTKSLVEVRYILSQDGEIDLRTLLYSVHQFQLKPEEMEKLVPDNDFYERRDAVFKAYLEANDVSSLRRELQNVDKFGR